MGFGHLAPSMSIVETLSVLFNDVMDFGLDNYKTVDRDWFVLSKGHGGPAYYSTLMLKGFLSEEDLYTLNQNNTKLPSHPDRNLIHGVDATTGSLGQGISQAVGIAKGLQIQGINKNVYCIIGDGEFNEGQVFEALTFASSQKLDNFIVMIDNNKKQLDGYTCDISVPYKFDMILEGLGYDYDEAKGADVDDIKKKLETLRSMKNGKPKCLTLDTIKGQGIKYFEELMDNHHLRFTDEHFVELDKYLELTKKELDVK